MLTETQNKLFDALVVRAEQLSGYPKELFISKCRKKEYVKIRTAITMALIECEWTLKDIGFALSNRDHCTIINMRKQYHNYLFALKNTGCTDSVIELTDVLKKFAVSSELNTSPSRKTNRILMYKTMVQNGSSLLTAIGTAA